MSTRTLLAALLTAALTMPIMAQTDAAPAEQPQPAAAPTNNPPAADPAPVAPPPAVTVAPVTAVSRDKDTLSVDFPDEDIKTILRNVADLFELNLVVPDTVTGKTTIKMHDVTWRQIFKNILEPINYTYVEEGNIIKILSTDALLKELPVTEVFVVNNAKAADIKPTIDGLVDPATGGKIVIDARSNALVVTAAPSRMSRIRGIVDQLDKATDQVMIESKFVEVTDRDIRNIGVNWASLSGMQVGVGSITQSFLKNSGQSSSNGTSSNSGGSTTDTQTYTGPVNTTTTTTTSGSTLTTQTTTTTDAAGNSVTNTTPVIVPTNTTNTTSTVSPATIGETASNSISSAFNNFASLTNTGGTSRLATAVFSASDFNVIISALKTQNNTKIVSNPTVVTLNNSEAVLNVGQEFPIPSYTYNTERGTFEVSGFTYKPIGVILKVTPQVNAQGVIKLALEPEVSQRNGETTFNGANIPIIATRKAKTQVSLKNGYTMGIGGLITSSINHGGTKVPVLGNIPVLGRLFSAKSINDESTNLLIFITAKTVTSDGAAPEEVFDPRSVKAIGLTHDDLPGNRAPKGTDIFLSAPAPEKEM